SASGSAAGAVASADAPAARPARRRLGAAVSGAGSAAGSSAGSAAAAGSAFFVARDRDRLGGCSAWSALLVREDFFGADDGAVSGPPGRTMSSNDSDEADAAGS